MKNYLTIGKTLLDLGFGIELADKYNSGQTRKKHVNTFINDLVNSEVGVVREDFKMFINEINATLKNENAVILIKKAYITDAMRKMKERTEKDEHEKFMLTLLEVEAELNKAKISFMDSAALLLGKKTLEAFNEEFKDRIKLYPRLKDKLQFKIMELELLLDFNKDIRKERKVDLDLVIE